MSTGQQDYSVLINSKCPDCKLVDCECYLEDEENEIIGYQCLGCGNVQNDTGLGYKCNRCYGSSLEEMHF